MRALLAVILFCSSVSAGELSYLQHRFDASLGRGVVLLPTLPPVLSKLQETPAAKTVLVDEELKTRLVERWTEALSKYESTKVQAQFLKDGKAVMKIERSNDLVAFGAFAQYKDGKVTVSEHLIKKIVDSLEAAGATASQIEDVITVKLLPIIAHELSHGHYDAELKQKMGFNYPVAAVEGEVIAHIEQALSTAEIKAKNKELWEKWPVIVLDLTFNSLERAASFGSAGVADYVKRNYVCPSVLNKKQEELVAFYQGLVDESETLKMYRNSMEEILPKLEGDSLKRMEALLKKIPPMEILNEGLKYYGDALVFLKDEVKFKALQDAYRSQVNDAEARLKKSLQP